MKIENDYLMKPIFEDIRKTVIENTSFPWFFKSALNENQKKEELNSYLTHSFYLNNTINSDYYNLVLPLLKKLQVKALLRVVANFYYKTDKIVEHAMHQDFKFPHKGALYSLNSCDGGTILEDGTKVKSKENTLLHLDTSKLHASTSTTDSKGRFNIIVNYF